MIICENDPRHSPIVYGGTVCPLCAALDEQEALLEKATVQEEKIAEQAREIFSLQKQLEELR